MELKVLITHISYQAAGSFIKLLRKSLKYQFYILGCDSIPLGFSSGSMLVDEFYLSPNECDYKKYSSFITNLCKDKQINIVISAEELDLLLFKKCNILQAFPQYIASHTIFELFRDKYTATIEIEKMGIQVPKTIMCLEEFSASQQKKFIQRKRISCSSRGIKIFQKHEIDKNYCFFHANYITQEFIDGYSYTVDVFCDRQGNLKLAIPRISLSEKDGTTFKCVIKKNERIIALCREIYNAYNIPGFSNIQFIEKNGIPYFIELNPRAAATMIAASLVSVNWLDLYIDNFVYGINLDSAEEMMKQVCWNSVISRYYEETILYGEQGDNVH